MRADADNQHEQYAGGKTFAASKGNYSHRTRHRFRLRIAPAGSSVTFTSDQLALARGTLIAQEEGWRHLGKLSPRYPNRAESGKESLWRINVCGSRCVWW